MDILDFEGSATPIILCDQNGRVLDKNSAAKRLTPCPRRGSKLKITPPICRLPQGRCFVVPFEGKVWLLFCDFLRFEFDGAIFPTAREVLMLSGEDLLKATAAHGALKASKSRSHLAKLQELLYNKFAFIFSAPADPQRVHSTASLLRGFEKVLDSPRISLTTSGGSSRLVNTRNATVLLTSLLSILLPHTKGRVKGDVSRVGDDLRLSVSAVTDLRFENSSGEALTDLYDFFPEHSADLFAIDLCVHTCGYTAFYETDEKGGIEISVYVKTETDLYALLDPAAKAPFEEELALLAEKL